MKYELYLHESKLWNIALRSINPRQRPFIYGFVFFLLILSCSENNSNKDYPTSFRGIKWGTKITELQDMVFVESREQLKAYVIENDDLKIGSTDINTVFYLFSEDFFCGVLVEYEGLDKLKKIKNLYIEKYGKPKIVNEPGMRWEWVWPGEVGVAVKYDKEKETGYLIYLYSPLLFKK
jgi:hypothetical protein